MANPSRFGQSRRSMNIPQGRRSVARPPHSRGVALRPSHARILEVIGIGVVLLVVAAYLLPRLGTAWDFDTFYYAATALRRGLDPYRLDVLSAVAGKHVPLPFLYPPVALALFVPFTWLSLHTATLVWLGLKLVFAIALITLWWRVFLRGTSLLLLLVVACFGFNAAMVMDLRTGNVSILEELLLWIAFGYYVQDRRWQFAFFIAIASIFKLLPIAFLALLLVPSKRQGPSLRPALAGLGLFAAIAFLPSLLGVWWARGFLTDAPTQRPYGEFNPCALGFFDMLLDPDRASPGEASGIALLMWAIFCAALLVSSWGALRGAWRRKDALEWVVIGSFLFALLSPRMMMYSYALLVAPTLLLARGIFPRVRDRAITLSLVTVQGAVRTLLRADFLWVVTGLPFALVLGLANLPFFVTLGLWLSYLLASKPATRAPRI